MKKQQKKKPPGQLAKKKSRSNLTKAALNLANQEIERLKKLIDKRVREISKLRKRKR